MTDKKKPYYLLTKEGKRRRMFLTDEESESDSERDNRPNIELINEPGPSWDLETLNPSLSNDSFSSELDHSLSSCSIISSDLGVDYDVNGSECSSDTSSLEIMTDDPSKDNDNLLPMKSFLRKWSKDSNISISALSSLCVGLKTHHPECFHNLPSDGRTIIKTPVSVNIQDMPPGQYIHFGLRRLLDLIFSTQKKLSNEIGLLFNIDGLPLFRSASTEFYPILFSIPTVRNIRNEVYPIGIYCGDKKPELAMFLDKFVAELIDLTTTGLNVKGKIIKISILGFCCDTPAKSYILGTTAHTGFSSCTRCKVHGITIEKRRVFLESNCDSRTHNEFVNKADSVYQPRTTPLVNVPTLLFPKSFVLDYMHVICLGVMRFLLNTWTSGALPLRMSKTQREVLSDALIALRNCVPDEFARKPRDLSQLKFWKATEYRMFLLYFGPVVLKNILDENKYFHFITLHVAVSFLLTPTKCLNEKDMAYAKCLLVSFFENFKTLYGEMYTSHNVHSLIHIVDDVIFFSEKIPDFTIHSVSAFNFENYLQKLKKKVRGKSKPLQQIGKRLEEDILLLSENCKHTQEGSEYVYPILKNIHNDGPLPALCFGRQYKRIIFETFFLSTTPPNNCAILTDKTIIIVENIVVTKDANKVVIGKQYLVTCDVYDEPVCKSSKLDIKKVEKMGQRKVWSITDIKGKCMLLQVAGKNIVFPMLHCSTSIGIPPV